MSVREIIVVVDVVDIHGRPGGHRHEGGGGREREGTLVQIVDLDYALMCAVPTAPAGIQRAEVGVNARGGAHAAGSARMEGVDAAYAPERSSK